VQNGGSRSRFLLKWKYPRMSPSQVHEQAIVAPGAKVAAGVRVGAYAVIGEHVELGEGCVLHEHAMVLGPSKIGRNNIFYPVLCCGRRSAGPALQGRAGRSW